MDNPKKVDFHPSYTSLLQGKSRSIELIREQMDRYAASDLNILVYGESGTGKELVAQALHEKSGRVGRCIAVNCGALPRELIESELFGHEKGSFTGAQRSYIGCFREAHNGTLFLDEIAELPLELQPKLLRAIEQRSVRPIGGTKEIRIDIRIIAATHEDLLDRVNKKIFRQDLYYRIAGVEIKLPPLREHPQDIPLLIEYFLKQFGVSLEIHEQELKKIMEYPWPGNVRQLKHSIHRALYQAQKELLADDVLPSQQWNSQSSPKVAKDMGGIGVIGRRFAEIEKDIYLLVLEATKQNCRAAAEMLGVPRSTFYERVRRYGIKKG